MHSQRPSIRNCQGSQKAKVTACYFPKTPERRLEQKRPTRTSLHPGGAITSCNLRRRNCRRRCSHIEGAVRGRRRANIHKVLISASYGQRIYIFCDLFRDDDPRLQMALHPRVSAVAQGIAVATHSSAARCPRRSALESVFSNRHGAARTSSLLEKYTDTLKHLSDCISESRCKLPA